MTVKVSYNANTFEVVGYYPDPENYKEIPKPNIEITKKLWQESFHKEMCVIDGIFQEKIEDQLKKLANAKISKLAQLKINLINAKEGETPKKGSLESYQIDGVFRSFKVKISDLATISARINRLEKAAVGITAQWTDVDGNRLDLNLQQFESLRNHLDVRDQTLHMLYEDVKNQIKACKTLEELEAIEINFV